MATIKSFSDLEQSRKLAEILPLESADMYYTSLNNYAYPWIWEGKPLIHVDDIPAWSLSALLSILPNNKHITTTLSRGGWKIDQVEYIDKWFCEYEDEVDENSPCKGFTVSADNPVDACVKMIENLHELKML